MLNKFLKLSHIILLFTLVLSQQIFGQTVFNELNPYKLPINNFSAFEITATRNIINLDGVWKVKKDASDSKFVRVSVPSNFKGTGIFVFEKDFNLSENDIKNKTIRLNFLGLNYSAEFSINNKIIYRHNGGAYPFKIDLPNDILLSESPNKLRVKLTNALTENTIPLKQRIFFPKNYGGIFRDVFISILPKLYFTNTHFKQKYYKNNITLNFNSVIKNNDFISDNIGVVQDSVFRLKIFLTNLKNGNSIILPEKKIIIHPNGNNQINLKFNVKGIKLWSIENPNYYKATLQLLNKGKIIDESKTDITFLSIKRNKNNLLLNGKKIILKGVTYIPSFETRGEMASYKEMEKDILQIKKTGFNAIRFAKTIPNPYYLELCKKYGLLAFIELPINFLPADFASDYNFTTRLSSYLKNYLNQYKKYNVIAAFGLGGGYYSKFSENNSLLNKLGAIVKKESDFLTYASFSDLDFSPIENLDFYGIELFNTLIDKEKINSLKNKVGNGSIFISEATYNTSAGNSNGFVNPFTYEAQAKYFSNLLSMYDKPNNAGFFINTMFNYSGDYKSLISGYSKNNEYNIGLMKVDKITKTQAYNIVYSKFHHTEKITIPIGDKKDQSPMVFIIVGLLLALGMGVLVNSGKKFREDSSRALLRPYNFFADIRDQRIISGFHTGLLAIIISITLALLLSNLLYFFKTNFLFEKILISFGDASLIGYISYLVWHPALSILWLSFFVAAILILLIIIIKLFSFLLKNKIYLSSTYFTVIWALLPIVLIIPLDIVLFRILNAEISNLNLYIYLVLVISFIIIVHRLLKGIYVVFDVRPGKIYFYSFITFLFGFGGILLYYQINNSMFNYLQLLFNF